MGVLHNSRNYCVAGWSADYRNGSDPVRNHVIDAVQRIVRGSIVFAGELFS